MVQNKSARAAGAAKVVVSIIQSAENANKISFVDKSKWVAYRTATVGL